MVSAYWEQNVSLEVLGRVNFVDIVELVGTGAVVDIVVKQTRCINKGYVDLKDKVILTERVSLANASRCLKVVTKSDVTVGFLTL